MYSRCATAEYSVPSFSLSSHKYSAFTIIWDLNSCSCFISSHRTKLWRDYMCFWCNFSTSSFNMLSCDLSLARHFSDRNFSDQDFFFNFSKWLNSQSWNRYLKTFFFFFFGPCTDLANRNLTYWSFSRDKYIRITVWLDMR